MASLLESPSKFTQRLILLGNGLGKKALIELLPLCHDDAEGAKKEQYFII